MLVEMPSILIAGAFLSFAMAFSTPPFAGAQRTKEEEEEGADKEVEEVEETPS